VNTGMRKMAIVAGLAGIGIAALWLAQSDNSPLNRCEPTSIIRVLFDGREYHIPVEWQPSISKRRDVRFPVRFGYRDHTGDDTGKGTKIYCQSPDEAPEEYHRISFDPQAIARATPDFWESHDEFKYLPALTYLGFVQPYIDRPPSNDPPTAEPLSRRLGTAFDGMYWRYEIPPGKRTALYSRNWTHEGGAVSADRSDSPSGTIGWAIHGTFQRGSNVRMKATNYHPKASLKNHLHLSIPPQEWPDMLAEATRLMRSFEIDASNGN
jgi:hypothetical protein